MKVFDWPLGTPFPGRERGVAIAVGVFDGVHLGHAEILKRVISLASGIDAAPSCFTFRNNPKRYLSPDTYPGDILSLDAKLGLIAASGIEAVVLADFDAAFASVEGQDFIRSLRERLGARAIVLGENSRLGKGASLRAAEAAAIASALGMASAVVPSLRSGGMTLSSSSIRTAIREGRLDRASGLLGRPFMIRPSEFEKREENGFFILKAAGKGLLLPGKGEHRVRATFVTGESAMLDNVVAGESDGESFLRLPSPLPLTLEFV